MAEHEVTEAMVDAACAAIVCEGENVAWNVLHGCENLLDADSSENNADGAKHGSAASVYVRCIVRTAIEAAIAARTTDASAASGATVLCSMPPFGPMLKSIATLGLDCTFDGKPMRDAIADAIAWCDVDLPQMAGADADWVLVPREYTDAQLASGIEQLRTVRKNLGEFASDETICGVIYDGMLASSPQQRAGDGG